MRCAISQQSLTSNGEYTLQKKILHLLFDIFALFKFLNFQRAAWALVFLSKFKKYGLISLKDLKEESYSNNITRTNNKKSNSCVSTSKIFKNDSEFLQTSIRWSVRLSNGSTESAFESLLKVVSIQNHLYR